ncbi:alcohol dehydrogenase [Phaeosphaeria sp. MPI-PUGE-AT-0046c]|nr:alcohol dehydrogenase [Phaeosphaeria sp. MPI-PUGE-AT-0046c]
MPSLTTKNRPSSYKPQKMRATIWKGQPFQVSVESIPKSRLLTSEDAVVRLTSAAICGSDLHTYRGLLGSANPPWGLGHEGVGIVEEVGEAVQLVKPGDRVIVSSTPDDGKFDVNLVPELDIYGFGPEFGAGNSDGMQAEYIRVPQADTSLFPIPHHPSRELDYLMISDIWGTAWTVLDISGFQAGETVAVFGAGPVGLLCAYTALFRGASRVYVVDHIKERLEKAREIGAIPINFTKGNAAKQILKLEPEGVARSCDCCGEECLNEKLEPQQNTIINDMVAVTEPGGGLGVVGVYVAQDKAPGRPNAEKISPTLEFPMTAFFLKSLSMKAAIVNPQALARQLLELVKSGRAHPGCIVSSVIGLEEIAEGYKRFNKQLETKVVIRLPWQQEEWHVGNGTYREASVQNSESSGLLNNNSLEG